jgi:mycofactocin glycosyltransferase
MSRAGGVSVVVPTIGRPRLLRACLGALTACDPAPEEIVVSDQSAGAEVATVVAEFAGLGARIARCPGRGRGRACNHGLGAARGELVLFTDDDCLVQPGWVGAARDHLRGHAELMVTGRVLAQGDAAAVPSTIEDEAARDHTGTLTCWALSGGNMGCHRETLLGLGGFDAAIRPAAEDNDLCYRWLRAGMSLRYEPDMVVWHHDWRSPAELVAVYVDYGRGDGTFYGKHLRAGDPRVLRFLAEDVRSAAAALAARRRRGPPDWPDPRPAKLRGLPRGLAAGLRLGPGRR